MAKFTLYGYPRGADVPNRKMILESFCGLPKPGISPELPAEPLEFYVGDQRWLYRGRAGVVYRVYRYDEKNPEVFAPVMTGLQAHADLVEEGTHDGTLVSILNPENYVCQINGKPIDGLQSQFRIGKKLGSSPVGSGIALEMKNGEHIQFRVLGINRPFVITPDGKDGEMAVFKGFRAAVLKLEKVSSEK